MRVHLALLAAVAAPAIAAAPAGAAGGKLVGTVGPGFTITVKTASGAAAKTLPHGTYALTVHDLSSIHDFHLVGPGLNKVVTAVGFSGTKTVTVTLKPGVYRFMCDPHSAFMHGSFRVS
jgi:plastocyanin